MKNRLSPLTLIPLLGLVCSCGNNGLVKTNVYTLNNDNKVESAGELPFYFFGNQDIPYISLEDGFAFATALRRTYLEKPEAGYTVRQTDKTEAVVSNESKASTVTFNVTAQTITFSNFDDFILSEAPGYYPYSAAFPSSQMKSVKIVQSESTHQKGEGFVIDLKAYPNLKLKQADDNHGILMPYSTFGNMFISTFGGNLGLSYNFKDAYFISAGLRGLGDEKPNALGQKFYSEAPKRKTVSKELAAFAYDDFLLNFDYFYGLKGLRKIASFRSYVQSQGLEADFLSGDLEKMEDAYASILFRCLEDGHTAYFVPSAFDDYDDFAVKDSCRGQTAIAKAKLRETMNEKREELDVDKPFEVVGDTAFIYFDDFEEIDEKILYGTLNMEVAAKNNVALFAYAYQQIKANPKVKNVVVDLVTNNGGDATGLVYCLGTLLGKCYIDACNPLTGAADHVTYLTDINVDGVIDDKDVPLCKDYNIVMLDSKLAFSCGNLLPVAAVYNNPKVKVMGDVSGGGTCVIKSANTALGANLITSGLTMLTKKQGDKYVDIEGGAAVDYPVAYEDMFNRAAIVNAIDTVLFPAA